MTKAYLTKDKIKIINGEKYALIRLKLLKLKEEDNKLYYHSREFSVEVIIKETK